MSGAASGLALVRHGQTEWNRERRIQGRSNRPLNETGLAQAAAAALALGRAGGERAPAPWSGVVTSPLLRAARTAEVVAAALGLPAPDRDAALLERDYGAAEGLRLAEAEARWPGLVIPGAEPAEALAARAAGALVRILAERPGAVVVAHGALLRAGIAALTREPMPRLENGSVWWLVPGAGGFSVRPLRPGLAPSPRAEACGDAGVTAGPR